jgi:hypothetical protein
MDVCKFVLVRNQADPDGNNFPDWQEFERSILRDCEVSGIKRRRLTRLLFSVMFRLMRRIGRRLGIQPPYNLPVKARIPMRVAILGGLSFKRCPDFILPGTKVAYLYDSSLPWSTTEQMVRFVEDTGISVLFVSHPTFRDRLQPHLQSCEVHFVPEAVDPGAYLSNEKKTIDVLSFGRALKTYHHALLTGLPPEVRYRHGWVESRDDLIRAMGAARIIINFPRSLTDETLDVEMLTMRYFQAFASRALVLGRCPPILKDVFGYDPVIAADLENPCSQIQDILRDFSSYQGLIDKNYQNLIARHTYGHRWQQMKSILNDEHRCPFTR